MPRETGLVSIVVPAFNAAETIRETIEAIQAQSISKWELLLIDDCSTDGTAAICREYALMDNRIKYHKTDSTSGSPAAPRNIGIERSIGQYIAFCDSDDKWLSGKLERQLPLFDGSDIAIVFSNYQKDVISEAGVRKSKVIRAPEIVDYHRLLMGNCIGCLTAIYDTMKSGDALMPRAGHEDYLFWLEILGRGFRARNTSTVEAIYRQSKNSVSGNKFKAMRWTWEIYYKQRKIGLFRSLYYFAHYVSRAFAKYL